MKNLYKYIALAFASACFAGAMSSCEDYLDKDPDSTISEDTAFKNFTNFQGYVEEIYQGIPDKAKCGWTTSWNWGDDEILNPQGDPHMVHQVDIGNFYSWQETANPKYNYLSRPGKPADAFNDASFNHGMYEGGWYSIAKINKGLNHIDEMSGTQVEKNLLLGQMYFFRAWFHFELAMYLGGLPYVDEEFDPSVRPELTRLSFCELADRCAEDFRKAADLLPIDWDATAPGKNTIGHNQLRINKIMALGYLGKTYLWAASPLMNLGAQTGAKANGKTYQYNKEYAQKAADAFGELLNLVETGQTQYKLAGFNYDDIYNHKKASGESDCYSDLFFTTGQSGIQPGAKEAIMRGPSVGWSFTRYNYSRLFGPNQLCNQDNVIHQPTANYVENYGMANGLPLDDPESGYDPKHPFKDRDPRFYHDIIFDGVKYINNTSQVADIDKPLIYAGLATGGSMRAVSNASRTGYFYQKLVPHTCQKYDQGQADDYGPAPHAYIAYMRLADVYLMYAEACAVLGDRMGKSSKCSLTSVDAVNKIRERCGAGPVAAKFTGNAYMDEIRRERAVELAFEGFRFNDLQRWLLLTEAPYNQKYSAEYIRVQDESWFAENDPRDAEVAEFHKELILTRNFDAKHYWFPLYRDDTYIFAGFEQNPGW